MEKNSLLTITPSSFLVDGETYTNLERDVIERSQRIDSKADGSDFGVWVYSMRHWQLSAPGVPKGEVDAFMVHLNAHNNISYIGTTWTCERRKRGKSLEEFERISSRNPTYSEASFSSFHSQRQQRARASVECRLGITKERLAAAETKYPVPLLFFLLFLLFSLLTCIASAISMEVGGLEWLGVLLLNGLDRNPLIDGNKAIILFSECVCDFARSLPTAF